MGTWPGAIQIVDLYHAGEHLWELARKLHSSDEAHQKRWIMIHQPKLDEGQIEKLRISRITGKRGVLESNFHVAQPWNGVRIVEADNNPANQLVTRLRNPKRFGLLP